MGVILEAAGLTEAAQHAYDKSASLMELVSTEEEAGIPAEVFGSSAITEDEVRLAARLLKGRFHPADLWGEEPDDCS
jgi:2-hydroxychromene-2-carboxylate isomerase